METEGSIGAGLTDDELEELYSLLQDHLLYGDDEVVYGTTESGKTEHQLLSSVMRKVRNEAKRRKLWWAK